MAMSLGNVPRKDSLFEFTGNIWGYRISVSSSGSQPEKAGSTPASPTNFGRVL